MSKGDVLLYAGPGSSFRFLVNVLPADIAEDHRIRLVSAEQVRSGQVFESACLFVLPGGEEHHHVRELGKSGNANLRRFVEEGGHFLGLCAGGYYGAAAIEYHLGLADEIIAPRPLGFFNGVAVGSIRELGGAYDKTLATATAASITVGPGQRFKVFYHGGARFMPADQTAQVLARYADLPEAPPAIVKTRIGNKGGTAVLCGVHPELSSFHVMAGFNIASSSSDDQRLVGQLQPDDRVRRTFWRGLLKQSGVCLSPLVEQGPEAGLKSIFARTAMSRVMLPAQI